MRPSELNSLSDDALKQIVDSHEMQRQKQTQVNFILRERAEGVSDIARAILRQRADIRHRVG